MFLNFFLHLWENAEVRGTMFFTVRIRKLRLSVISVLSAAAVCLGIFGSVPKSHAENEVRLCVVMYHGLIKEKGSQNKYMIDPSVFEKDLKYLTENGYHTIFVSELVGYFENNNTLPEKPVLITFDDGYYNNYTYAFPLLKKYGCKAVISMIGIEADKAEKEKNKKPLYSECGWTELREMTDSGFVEIQNHTYDLHHIKNGVQGAGQISGEDADDYKRRLCEDIDRFDSAVQRELGKRTECFTYPFGAKNSLTEEIVKNAGFRAAMDCEEKTNVIHSKEELLHIHRYLRTGGMSSEEFFLNKL